MDLLPTLNLAKTFFERMNYFGKLEFELFLENVNPGGSGIDLLIGDGRSYKYRSGQHVQVSAVLDTDGLNESRSEILKDILRRVLREGDVAVTEDFLETASQVE